MTAGQAVYEARSPSRVALIVPCRTRHAAYLHEFFTVSYSTVSMHSVTSAYK